jgi:hypothetical protein
VGFLLADFELWERDWIWWSSAVVGDYIKIDLEVYSLPTGFLPIEATTHACGGKVILYGDWFGSSAIESNIAVVESRLKRTTSTEDHE